MNNLNEYMSKFFTKGVYLFCSDKIDKYSLHLTNQKSFICGSFWAIAGLSAFKSHINEEDLVKVLKKLKSCIKSNIINGSNENNNNILTCDTTQLKGFSEFIDHNLYETNIQSTLYAVQTYYILKTFKQFENYDLNELLLNNADIECIINYVKALFDSKLGCFYNSSDNCFDLYNKKGNIASRPFKADLRHTMAALCTLNLCYKMLGYDDNGIKQELDIHFNTKLMFSFLKKHFNLDGGVSLQPNGESNVAACFCLVGSLIFINRLQLLSTFRIKALVSWLLQRVSINGGINGRVGKSNDICYIWWNLATLMLIRQHYPVRIKLFNQNIVNEMLEFIRVSQNDDGGFACNKSTSVSDPYHSFTAILSTSLLNEYLDSNYTNISDIGHDEGSSLEATGTMSSNRLCMDKMAKINPLYAIPCND